MEWFEYPQWNRRWVARWDKNIDKGIDRVLKKGGGITNDGYDNPGEQREPSTQSSRNNLELLYRP